MNDCEKIMPTEHKKYITWGDTMNVFDGKPRLMDFQGEYFECGDGAEYPTHWIDIPNNN